DVPQTTVPSEAVTDWSQGLEKVVLAGVATGGSRTATRLLASRSPPGAVTSILRTVRVELGGVPRVYTVQLKLMLWSPLTQAKASPLAPPPIALMLSPLVIQVCSIAPDAIE